MMMKLNKTERAGVARILKLAKPHLWNGRGTPNSFGDDKEEFICYALHKAVRRHDVYGQLCYTGTRDVKYVELAKQIISSRLFPHTDLESWVMGQGIEVGRNNWPAVQAHRHAWLNMLIKEFSK